MNVAELDWWEREKLFTTKDYEAIRKARMTPWQEIDESWAETEAGRMELHDIIMRKYHDEEFLAGML